MEFDRVSMQSGGVRLFERPGSDIRISGYLKKLKTMKKKYFVLRSTSSSGPARLEYYDSEKKFHGGHLPKRAIHLHTCFNINRKSDSRHKNAIALYTKEECFSVVCEDEKEQENWLSLMLEYQNEYVHDGERCREHYEYVWQVTVQPKGLGQTMNMRGSYRLCLTCNNVCLVKLNTDKPQYVFQLETVRSLAHNDTLFRMEVGKIAPTGEGEIWMQADDAVIAQNLHETILNFMKSMDRRYDLHDNRRPDNTHGSSSTLPRQSSEFRHRTCSENFSQGTSRNRSKPDRPASVYTGTTRSNSHLHNTTSPGTSPHTHSFVDHQIIGSHRMRSDSNESKASRSSMSGINEDLHDLHNLSLPGPSCDIMPLEEEEADCDVSGPPDQLSIPSSPGSHLGDGDDLDGQGEGYMEMTPGSATPPTPGNNGYIDMAPLTLKDSKEGWTDQASSSSTSSSYIPMIPTWSSTSSAPIPIHPPLTEYGLGYMEMSTHNPLPPVKEGGSTEGYLPMSPSYSASPSGSSSQLRPDRVACMLSDDGSDYPQPPTRTYSLGSRPVKAGTVFTGYVDMSGRKGVSDNGRSCSAPHLINHHHAHHHRNSSRNSTLESPTPSASPLSISLRSDDSDSFMELDFYRPRTASDSYSYRPRASSFGMPPSSLGGQGHRPRSSSHGQGTRPLQQHKMLQMGVDSPGRLTHDMFHRSLNSSSHGSFDSLKVSSSESLKKLPQEVRMKTSQLNSGGYMDMSFERRHTPSPQPGSSASSRSGQNGPSGYVDMTLGHRKSSPSRSKIGSRSNSKTSSSEKLPESDYTNMSLGGGGKSNSAERLSQSDYTNMSLGSGGKTGSSEKLQESDYTNMSLGSGKASSSEKLQESDYTNMSLGNVRTSSSEKCLESDYTTMSFGGGSSMTDSAYINFDLHEGGGRKEVPSQSSSSENVDAYIMYEPATKHSGSSSSGGKTAPKGEATSPDPRNRSGSAGKEQKKRSFFSLRHSDSLKHGTKKTDVAQSPSGMIGYSSTGGDKFGSLGRDIRQKSKDSSKGSGRKSSSFSRTFGISTNKPGKLSRKTPTPPKSLDGNDEYIEFSPTAAVRSDSDSSHSSGSSKSSRARQEVARQEAEYVGFEPGNIPACSSQRTNSTISGYVPMNAAGGQGSGLKPGKRSGTKRSKSKDETSAAALSAPHYSMSLSDHGTLSPPLMSGQGTLSPSSTPGDNEDKSLAMLVPLYVPGQDQNVALGSAKTLNITTSPVKASAGSSPTNMSIPPAVVGFNPWAVPACSGAGSVSTSITVSISSPTASVSTPTVSGEVSATSVKNSVPVSKSTALLKTGPAVKMSQGDGGSDNYVALSVSSSSSSSVSTSSVSCTTPAAMSAFSFVTSSSVLSSSRVSSSSAVASSKAALASTVTPRKTMSSSSSTSKTSPVLSSPESSLTTSQSLSSPNSSFVVVTKPSPLNTCDSGYMDFDPQKSASTVESSSSAATAELKPSTIKSYVSDGAKITSTAVSTEINTPVQKTKTAEETTAPGLDTTEGCRKNSSEIKPEVVKSYIVDDASVTKGSSVGAGPMKSLSNSCVSPTSGLPKSGLSSPLKNTTLEKQSPASEKSSSEKSSISTWDRSTSEKSNPSPSHTSLSDKTATTPTDKVPSEKDPPRDKSAPEKSNISLLEKSPSEKRNSFPWDKSPSDKSSAVSGNLSSSAEMRVTFMARQAVVSPNGWSRKTPGGGAAVRSRRLSGDKATPGGNGKNTEVGGQDSSTEESGTGALSGSGGITVAVSKETRSAGWPATLQPGLTRPESTPCMLSMDQPTPTPLTTTTTAAATTTTTTTASTAPTMGGRGRGRHCSSSSAGGTGPYRRAKNNSGNNNTTTTNGTPAKDNNGNRRTDSGMLQINSEAEARHSITDLSGYEQMSFPSNALSRQQPAHFHSRQQQPSLGSSQGSNSTGGSQGMLNYATLDLGSADSMGEAGDATRSPRNKSRHPSAAEEKGEPLSYATIDFEKSESLRNAVSKDPKLTL